MNTTLDENTKHMRIAKKKTNELGKLANQWNDDKLLKEEPEARIFMGIYRGLQTKIYDILRMSQTLQVDIKEASREKITRHVKNVEPNLSPTEIENLVNDPKVILCLLTYIGCSNAFFF